MSRSRSNYDKGIYGHAQIGGFMSLKQFIFVKKNGQRFLLLRFENDFHEKIDSMEFVLNQTDSAGRRLNTKRISYEQMSVLPGDTYSSEIGIPVLHECVDFTVNIIFVVAGKYKYTFKHGRAVAHYDKRGYKEAKRSAGATNDSEVVSELLGKKRTNGLIALVALVLLAVFSVFMIIKAGEDFGNIGSSGIAYYETDTAL